MQASSDVIRDIAKEIKTTISNLQNCSEKIQDANRATSGWDDEKGAEFNLVMSKVARLVDSPTATLQAALPKLEALAQAVDAYNSQKIGG